MESTEKPSIAQIKSHWDQFAKYYISNLESESTESTKKFFGDLTTKFRAAGGKHKLPPNSRVLEIGCGSGMFAEFLLLRNKSQIRELHLLDLSGPMVEACSRRIAALCRSSLSDFELGEFRNGQRPIAIKRQNAEKLSQFPDNNFDFVLVNFVVHLTAEPQKMAREVFRVLKPKGAAMFSVLSDFKRSPFFHVYMDLFEAFGKSDRNSHRKFFLGTKDRLRILCSDFKVLGFEKTIESVPISKSMAKVGLCSQLKKGNAQFS